ncbi:MAG: pyrrolo-quinoline quinone [Burkholderiaceae bacterium]|nr:MAG: pyrrolo-quinoline quinone [Burkholderiaceae bacterium]
MHALDNTRKIVAHGVLILFGWMQILSAAHATDLADIPIWAQSLAKPNIMYTLDNSGSMAWQEMPDVVWSYCTKSAYKSSSYNRMYYNPNVTYTVPVKADGTLFTVPAWPNAYVDGYVATPSTRDISTSFTADEYGCNGATAAFYCTYNAGASLILKSPGDNATVNDDANFTCQTVPSAQRTNFIIWHSYYRTRIMATKASLALAFSRFNDAYRVGFYTINDNSGNKNTSGANFLNTADFNAANKATWYSMLFSIQPGGSTPLQEAVRRVGEYYKTGTLPGASGSVDPIQYSCQDNYNILSTDGYWNDSINVSVGNQDKTAPTLPEPVTNDPVSGGALTSNATWPRPFYEGSTATSDTLADVAMKYWVTDLRTSGSTAPDNVHSNVDDSATWQHVAFFGIGMGADGSLTYNATTLANLKSGAIDWPVPSADDPTAIDDLWHATVNGHGQYFSAADPTALQSGLTAALDTIVSHTGSAAAIAVVNPIVTSGDNRAYLSTFNTGDWTGDLQAYPIDPATGIVNTATPVWSPDARGALDSRTPASRYIVSYSGTAGTGQGIQFQSTAAGTTTKLSSAQQTLLNTPSTTDGANVVAYLRGDRSLEGTTYRTRIHLLGDLINAEPVVVRNPLANYVDTDYSTFKTAQASRTKVVFQGGNDGMLHAFTEATGAENWAYIPNLILSTLNQRTRLTGFTHKYYVDGTPTVNDVDFQNTSSAHGGGTNWGTILVGGLNNGGRGYYALDVTTPTAASEANAAAKVLWEFPNSATSSSVAKNIGNSFGKPVIVETTKGWVVLVTSGYNNGSTTGGDGQGHLFVLDAATGALIKDLSTGVGSSANPSGLAQISAYVENSDLDPTTSLVYGGDLNGNLWRFDLSGNNTSSWSVSRLTTLVDGGGSPQPITTKPELSKVYQGGVYYRTVFVGTGQYLGTSDVGTSQTQTMYGIVDDMTAATISPLRSQLVAQSFSSLSATTRQASNNAVSFSANKGWYIDLPTTGERVNTNPQLGQGILTFTSNIPSSDACLPGGSSWFNVLNYATGGYISVPGITGSSVYFAGALSTAPRLIRTTDGKMRAVIVDSSGNVTTTQVGTGSGSGVVKRFSWRELITQ